MRSSTPWLWLAALCALLVGFWLVLGVGTGDADPVDSVPLTAEEEERETVPGDARVRRAAAETPLPPPAEAPVVVALDWPSKGSAPAPQGELTTITGIVRDVAGRPLARAQVDGFPAEPGEAPSPDASATTYTDTWGRFGLAVPDGAFLVVASKPALRPSSVHRVVAAPADPRPVELVLEGSIALAGRITKQGEPVRGARVRVDLAYGTPGLFGAGEELFWRDGRVETKHGWADTDEEGRYRIMGLSPYEYRLVVDTSLDGFDHPDAGEEKVRRFTVPNEHADVDLVATEIRVFPSMPIEYAEMGQLVVTSERAERTWSTNDLSSSWKIVVAPDATYRVRFDHPLAKSNELVVSPLVRGEVREVPLDITPRSESELLEGVVVDEDGETVERAWVGLFPMNGDTPQSHARIRTTTSAQGRFTLPRFDGSLLLVAATRNFRPTCLVIHSATRKEPLRLTLERGHSISGTVRRAGVPLVGERLSLDLAYGISGLHGCGPELFWRDGRVETKHASVHTNADGRYVLRGLAPAEHRVFLGNRSTSVTAPTDSADFSLD